LAEQRRLARPPLREAVIDLRAEEALDSAFLPQLEALAIDDFTSRKAIREGHFSFDLSENRPASTAVRDAQIGFRLENADASRVVQFRLNGFTFSVLKGYVSWEQFVAEAKVLWSKYLMRTDLKRLSRIALRYINFIELPLAEVSFDDYLTAAPQVPPGLPQGLSSFLQRVVVPFPASGHTAIITQALEPPSPTGIPVILDIDVFSEQAVSTADEELWTRLLSLRKTKNDIFFSYVTDLALKGYQ
jgi:uncharacterized protein (TIGR04255 family)